MRISDWSSDVCSSDLDAEHDLDAVYRTHRTSLFHFLRRKAGPEEAPDLVQEVFARAAGSEQRHRLVNPGGFLRRIAQNLLIDRARRHKSTPTVLFPLREESDAVTPAAKQSNPAAADRLRLYETEVARRPHQTTRRRTVPREIDRRRARKGEE